ALFPKERWKEASAYFEKAVAVLPIDPIPFYDLAATYFNQGLLERARDALEESLRLDWRSKETHLLLERVTRRMGLSDIALKHSALAKELDEHPGHMAPFSSRGRARSNEDPAAGGGPQEPRYMCFNTPASGTCVGTPLPSIERG